MRLVPLVIVVVALAVAGCASVDRVVAEDTVSGAELEDLRDGRGLPMYFAGGSFDDLPLTGAEGWESGPGEALFAYGTCELPEGEGGCAVPIQIQHFRFRAAQWKLAEGCSRLPSLRGVPTARHDGLVVFTGSIVVKVYTRNPAEDRRVVEALRGLNNDLRVGEPFPPPAAVVERLLSRVCP